MGLLDSSRPEQLSVVICQISRPLKAHSTRHGARPGPTLSPRRTREPPGSLGAKSGRENQRPGKKKVKILHEKKRQFGAHGKYKGPLRRDVVDLKSRAVSKFWKRGRERKHHRRQISLFFTPSTAVYRYVQPRSCF